MKKLLTRFAAVLVLVPMLYVPGTASAATIPQPVLRMYDELAKVSSYSSNTTLKIDALYAGQKVNGSLTITSVSDTREKAEVGFVLTVSTNIPEFKREMGASSVTAKGTIRVLSNKKAYIYFDDLPNVKPDGIDLAKFERKWIDLSGEADSYVRMSGKSESFASLVARMKSSLTRYPAFSFYEEGSTTSAYRYRIAVNPMYLTAYMNAVNDKRVSLPSADIAEMFSGIKDVRAYITIDKATYLPKEVTAEAKVSDTVGFSPLTVNVSVKNTYASYNAPVNIKKPTKVTSFEKLMEDLLGPARKKGADASAKSNLASFRAYAELYYDDTGSYAGYCTSSTGKRYLSSAGKTNCYAKGQEYAAQVKLSSGYYCVDSTGSASVTKKSTISSKDLMCN